MARMIPSSEDFFNRSFGESQVFNALSEKLPDDYTVFHSFRWNKRNEKGRITWGEADFTVFHPERGILIIEVKSGGVALEEGQWWYERTDNQRRFPMQDPLEQANRTKYAIKDLLEEKLAYGDYCWIEPAVWFPSISDREIIQSMPNTYHGDIVFMDRALENPKQAIENAYKYYNCARRTKLSPESVKILMRTLAPAFYAVPSLSASYAEQEAHFLRLTNEQNGLLDYLEEQPDAAINGSAGTGKTLLAVEKARRLATEDKVLFLCFNRFLMEELRRNNEEYPNILFYNLQTLTKRYAGGPDIPQDDDISAYLNHYDEYGKWDFKHIIIDEGQDFADQHLELLRDIADIQEGVFYVFYDRNQLIQRRELPRWVIDAECKLVLRKNCRNTFSIAKTAGSPIEVEPKLWERSLEGVTPDFFILDTKESLVQKLGELVSQYASEKIPVDQITIVTVKTEERSILANVDKVKKWPLVSKRDGNGILFTTARKFKGLESAVIILVDVDSETFATKEARSLFYVGASRAKSFLNIVTYLEEGELQHLGDTLTDKVNVRNVPAQIAKQLKVKPHRK